MDLSEHPQEFPRRPRSEGDSPAPSVGPSPSGEQYFHARDPQLDPERLGGAIAQSLLSVSGDELQARALTLEGVAFRGAALLSTLDEECRRWLEAAEHSEARARFMRTVLTASSEILTHGAPAYDARHGGLKRPLFLLGLALESRLTAEDIVTGLALISRDCGAALASRQPSADVTSAGVLFFDLCAEGLGSSGGAPARLSTALSLIVRDRIAVCGNRTSARTAIPRLQPLLDAEFIGPDGIMRAMLLLAQHGSLLFRDSYLPHPFSTGPTSVGRSTLDIGVLPNIPLLNQIEYHLRALPTTSAGRWPEATERLGIITASFLARALSHRERELLFAPERAIPGGSNFVSSSHSTHGAYLSERPPLPALTLALSQREQLSVDTEIHEMRGSRNLKELTLDFLQAPGTTSPVDWVIDPQSGLTLWDSMQSELAEIRGTQHERLCDAVAFALVMQNRLDCANRSILQQVFDRYPNPLAIENILAREAWRILHS